MCARIHLGVAASAIPVCDGAQSQQEAIKAPSNCLFSFFVDHSNGSFNLKALSGGSGYKFGVLAKIVNYMKVWCFGVK